MDYTKLLFALQIRDLAFKMMHKERPDIAAKGGVPDEYPDFVRAALKEATSTANFIERELSEAERQKLAD